jgi:hypothetical protein
VLLLHLRPPLAAATAAAAAAAAATAAAAAAAAAAGRRCSMLQRSVHCVLGAAAFTCRGQRSRHGGGAEAAARGELGCAAQGAGKAEPPCRSWASEQSRRARGADGGGAEARRLLRLRRCCPTATKASKLCCACAALSRLPAAAALHPCRSRPRGCVASASGPCVRCMCSAPLLLLDVGCRDATGRPASRHSSGAAPALWCSLHPAFAPHAHERSPRPSRASAGTSELSCCSSRCISETSLSLRQHHITLPSAARAATQRSFAARNGASRNGAAASGSRCAEAV